MEDVWKCKQWKAEAPTPSVEDCAWRQGWSNMKEFLKYRKYAERYLEGEMNGGGYSQTEYAAFEDVKRAFLNFEGQIEEAMKKDRK